MCAGCPGCEVNLSDRDLQYELDLEAMMSERPDGNSGPPQTSFANGWHVTDLRMVPTPRGRGPRGQTHHRKTQPPMTIEHLAQRTARALERARQ